MIGIDKEKVEVQHSLPVRNMSTLWLFLEVAIPLTLCIHEWKCCTERKMRCHSLSVVYSYTERALKWNAAWYHSQAKDNSIECLSKMGYKMYGVTYKLLTMNSMRCVTVLLLTFCWSHMKWLFGCKSRSALTCCYSWVISSSSTVAELTLLLMKWDAAWTVKVQPWPTFYLLWDKIRLVERNAAALTSCQTLVEAWNAMNIMLKAWLTLYWSWDEIIFGPESLKVILTHILLLMLEDVMSEISSALLTCCW